MKKVNLKFCLLAIAGLGLSANANAAITCSDLEFSPEAFAAYSQIDKACLEVIERDNGQVYAKLTARVVAQTASGTHVRYRHADGELGPSHLSTAPSDFEAKISGKPVVMKDLDVRQSINIYVGNAYWVDLTLLVEEAIVEEIIEEAIIEEIIEEEIIEEELEAELPTTAGPLPWLALFGSLFLLMGGALRLSRKQ
jgi:hypothetical protein